MNATKYRKIPFQYFRRCETYHEPLYQRLQCHLIYVNLIIFQCGADFFVLNRQKPIGIHLQKASCVHISKFDYIQYDRLVVVG